MSNGTFNYKFVLDVGQPSLLPMIDHRLVMINVPGPERLPYKSSVCGILLGLQIHREDIHHSAAHDPVQKEVRKFAEGG